MLLCHSDATAVGEELMRSRQVASRFSPHLQTYVVTRNDVSLADASSECVWDSRGAVHSRFDVDSPALCLVRPDGHLGFRALPPSWDALETHLSQVLLTD